MDDKDPGAALYTQGMPKDIQKEVQEHILKSQPVPVRPETVRFKDNPVVIPLPSQGPDCQYHICQDLMSRKADVMFGQLLHDNVNYQRQVMAEFGWKQKRRYVLPSRAIYFVLTKDLGAPKIEVIIDGICVPNVPVDGGSGVNIMLEATAFHLGYFEFKPTPTILRMADQSKVIPIYRTAFLAAHSNWRAYIPAQLRNHLGRHRDPLSHFSGESVVVPSRCTSGLEEEEFCFGKPTAVLSWEKDGHQGKTDTENKG
jgi:hypothetical protein